MLRATVMLIALLAASCAQQQESAETSDLSPARFEFLTLNDTTFGRERTVRVWLPAGYDESGKTYPVLYMFDGQPLFDAALSPYSHAEWRADEAAAQLIAEGKIPPLMIVGIDNAPDGGREQEYLPWAEPIVSLAADDAHGDKLPAFFNADVFPLIDAKYRTDPLARGLGGSSFGGVATLNTAIKAPGLFSRIIVESPSLWVADRRMLTLIEDTPAETWPQRVFMAMGGREASGDCDAPPTEYDRWAVRYVRLAEFSLREDGLAQDRFKVVIDECAAHSETAWAERFPAALEFVYGKP